MPKINLNLNVMQFGKHKGKTIHEILVYDPCYLVWLVNNVDADKMPTITAKEYIDADHSCTDMITSDLIGDIDYPNGWEDDDDPDWLYEDWFFDEMK